MKQQSEQAVSPVVGVMLMLIVVIIIAAVVSGFAGGLVGGKNQQVPQITMDVSIANSGYWSTSYLKGEVTGTSGPINTKDLQIVTSWRKNYNNGTAVITGGATTTPGVVNFNVMYSPDGSSNYDLWRLTVPQGFGTGVGQGSAVTGNSSNYLEGATAAGGATLYDLKNTPMPVGGTPITNNSWWGNYYLQAGTQFLCQPFGGLNNGQAGAQYTVGYGVNPSPTSPAVRYQYVYSSPPANTELCPLSMDGGTGYGSSSACSGATFLPYPTGSQLPDPEPSTFIPSVKGAWDPRTYSIDQMQGVLGPNWNQLRAGDIVTMKLIHIPTGKIIWQRDIVVQGSVL